jgi:histidinol-phosphatase (PHP family)
MLQNLHTHTQFCDGKSTAEEMIDAAIKKGFDSLGFSAHAPMAEYGGYEIKNEQEYISEILRLKEKYADKIEIFLGIEADYYSKGKFTEDAYDYKIASVHHAIVEGEFISFDHSAEIAKDQLERLFKGDSLKYAQCYYGKMAELPERIKADFVGHFDLVTKFSEIMPTFINTEAKEYKNAALEALHAIRERMEFFEVNTGAISRGYRTSPYPAPFILEEMKATDCKLILTSDCHNKDFIDCRFSEAKEYIRAHGFDTLYYLTKSGFTGEKI